MAKSKINEKLSKLFALGDKLDERLVLEYESELAKAYQTALNQIRLKIGKMFERYGNDVSYQDMVTYKRLVSLESEIVKNLKKLGVSAKRTTKGAIQDAYQQSFQYSGYALESQIQQKLNFSLLSQNQLDASLYNQMNNIKWSDSVNEAVNSLVKQIRSEITAGLIEGKGYSGMTSAIKDRIDKSFGASRRIIWTETHRVQTAGRLLGIKKAQAQVEDVDIQVKWLATLDQKTRRNHGAMDGKAQDENGEFTFTTMTGSVIKVQGPGLTGTTDDIHCRCTITTEFDGITPQFRKDNESKEVIPYKTYDEWYKAKYGTQPPIS